MRAAFRVCFRDCRARPGMRKPPADVKSKNTWRWLLALLGVVLVAGAALTFVFGRQFLAAREETQRRGRNVADLHGLLSAVQDAETGQRGYLLTQEEIYLAPYRTAAASLRDRLAGLKERASAGQLPPGTVADLEQLVAKKLNELQRTIDLAQTLRAEEAASVVKTGEGREAMDGVRDRITILATGQEQEQSRAEAREKEAAFYATMVIAVTLVINLVLLAVLFVCVQRATVDAD